LDKTMDSLILKIARLVQSKDVEGLANIMRSGSWLTLGSGDQRTVAGAFVSSVVAAKETLPLAQALDRSPGFVEAAEEALRSLPPSPLENAADNILRHILFEYYVGHDVYSAAAKILATTRMEDEPHSVYFHSPVDKCDVYVKIAECYLQEDDTVEADSFVTKAGAVVDSIENPENHRPLILRYKSTNAQIMDSNRKFLQAATRYHELSQLHEDVDAEELLFMLGRAATCAILAPTGPQKQRILGLIYDDPRLSSLDGIPQFCTHASAIRKMYNHQVLETSEVLKFEESLAEHQRALRGDGLTIMEHAVFQHNILAVGRLYKTIYLSELGQLLGFSTSKKAETMVSNMIKEGTLKASIDQVDDLLTFESEASPIMSWDDAITTMCFQLNKVAVELESEAEVAFG